MTSIAAFILFISSKLPHCSNKPSLFVTVELQLCQLYTIYWKRQVSSDYHWKQTLMIFCTKECNFPVLTGRTKVLGRNGRSKVQYGKHFFCAVLVKTILFFITRSDIFTIPFIKVIYFRNLYWYAKLPCAPPHTIFLWYYWFWCKWFIMKITCSTIKVISLHSL